MLKAVKFTLFTVVPVIQDVLIIILFVRGLVLRKKRKASRYDHLVSLSSVLLWFGTIGSAILSIPVTLFTAEESDGVWYLFEIIILACIAMMLAYCNETIIYDGSGFTTSNLFRKKRIFSWEEISGVTSRRGGDIILRCGRQKIRVDAMAIERDEFITIMLKVLNRR